MQLKRFDDAAAFAQRAEPFLLKNEAEHNLLLGIAGTLIHTPERYPDPYMATIEQDGTVIGVAMRTPPHNAILSMGLTAEMLTLIAADLRTTYGTLPGALGPKAVVREFVEGWAKVSGQTYHLDMEERIYQLEKVQPASGIPGTMRPVTEADRDLVLRWMTGFNEDIFGMADAERVAATVDHFLAGQDRGLFLWEDGGRPVSLTGYGSPTQNGIRINAVYTPPESRRRGYASALVARVSQLLLDRGIAFCFLFTDLGNPTSNHIYQDIGYVPVCDVDQYEFV